MAAVAHLGYVADTAASLTYVTASLTPTVGDLIVVGCAATGSIDATATMTESAGGGTYTQVAQRLYTGAANTMFIFVANQLVAAATARTFTFTLPTDAGTGGHVAVERVTGMTLTGSAALKQAAVSNQGGAASTPSGTLGVAATTTNPLISFVVNGSSPPALTPPASPWAELLDTTGYATPTSGFHVAAANSGFTAATFTYGATSATAWGMLAVELDAAGAAAAASLLWKPPPTLYLR